VKFKDIFVCVCLGVLTIAMTVPLVYLWPVARRISADSAILLDCTYLDTAGKRHGNPACLPSELLATGGSIRAATGAIAKHMPAIAQAAEDASKHSVVASDNTATVIKQLGTVVQDADVAVKDVQAPLLKLGTSIDTLDGVISDVRTATIPKLDGAVDSLKGLVSDLRPTAQASTELVTAATGDMQAFHGTLTLANAMLADPDLALTIKNFADASKHLDGAAANGEQLTGEFRDMFKPSGKASFWETLAMNAVKAAAGPVAGSLVTHFWPQRVDITNTVPVTLIPPASSSNANSKVKK
jgi:hypothetical protein